MKEAIKGSPHDEGGNQRGNQAHQSTPLPCPLDRMSSGARYSGVPQSVHVRSMIFLANPKSHTCHKRDAARGRSRSPCRSRHQASSRVLRDSSRVLRNSSSTPCRSRHQALSRVIRNSSRVIRNSSRVIRNSSRVISNSSSTPCRSRARQGADSRA